MSVWPLLGLQTLAAIGPTDAARYDAARYGTDRYGSGPYLPWVELSCDTVGIGIRRTGTRDPVLTHRPDPASLTLALLDPDGAYDPADPTGPYAGDLDVRAPVEVRTHGRPVIRAYTDLWRHDPAAARSTLIGTDAAGIFAGMVPGTLQRGAESSVQRVTALAAIAASGTLFPPALEAVGAGTPLLPVRLDGDAWSMILATAQADRALVTVCADGTIRYDADWDRRASPPPVATLGCTHRGDADAHALNWPTVVDTDLLVNAVAVRAAGTDGETDQVVTAVDPGSLARYGPSSGGTGVTLPLPLAELEDWAADAVRLGSLPVPHIEQLSTVITGTEADAATQLAVWWSLDVGDTVRWVGHDGAESLHLVAGIAHDVDDRGTYTGTLVLGRGLTTAGYDAPTSRYGRTRYA